MVVVMVGFEPTNRHRMKVLLYQLSYTTYGGPLEDRTPTFGVQSRRAPIITSSPYKLGGEYRDRTYAPISERRFSKPLP